jgi:ribosomal protein L7Ae-like RNA K-turn-binding protein
VSSDGLREQVIDVIGRAALDGLSLASAAGAIVGGHDALVRELTAHRIAAVVGAEDASERTITSLKEAAGPDVSFVVLPLDRDALGQKVGRGPRAALGVTSSRSASHLRQQLRRLRQLR